MATRKELRLSVGRNLGGLRNYKPTISTADNLLSLPASIVSSNMVGDFIYYDGQIALVSMTGTSGTDGELTLDRDLTGTTMGDEVEHWVLWSPEEINAFINQAILEAHGRVYQHEDPFYECITPHNRRITLDDKYECIIDVYTRKSFDYTNLSIAKVWESNDSGDSVELDYYDFQYSPSTRLNWHDTSASSIFTDEIAQLDLSGMTHIEAWFKTTDDIGVTLKLFEGTTERASMELDLTDNEWGYVQVELPDRHLLQEIDSIQIVPSLDGGSSESTGVIWVNDIYAVDHDSIAWVPIDRDKWRIERGTRELVIAARSVPTSQRESYHSFGARAHLLSPPPENVMRIVGGSNPPDLTSDDDETPVDNWFIVCKAVELGFGPNSGGATVDPERQREQVRLWAARSDQARRAFQPLQNIRRVV